MAKEKINDYFDLVVKKAAGISPRNAPPKTPKIPELNAKRINAKLFKSPLVLRIKKLMIGGYNTATKSPPFCPASKFNNASLPGDNNVPVIAPAIPPKIIPNIKYAT